MANLSAKLKSIYSEFIFLSVIFLINFYVIPSMFALFFY
jgi:hypothetical protein